MKNEREKNTPPAERILVAAMEVFAAQGFAGGTMEAIASRAGVNKAAIYYHVGGKAALYETVLRRFFGRTADVLEAAVDGAPDAASGMSALIASVSAQFRDNPSLPRIMMHEWARYGASLSEGVLLELGRLLRCTQKALKRGVAEGVFRETPVWPLHLAIVGPMLLFSVTREVRARVSSHPAAADLRLIMSFDEMSRALTGILLGSLTAPAAGARRTAQAENTP
ncbi:MAG: TetR/AcrR family transcriptional regulator [Desulfovibrionaceae bacterium]|nr:TetR/AcrR family transcriptional regulator [Desulfovibrionaceae bacterium]MBF0514629.1 TetR/AcrR family transcriptional regulator [Desulfovibrionaceae bacterium]